jgi:hypothetical protein
MAAVARSPVIPEGTRSSIMRSVLNYRGPHQRSANRVLYAQTRRSVYGPTNLEIRRGFPDLIVTDGNRFSRVPPPRPSSRWFPTRQHMEPWALHMPPTTGRRPPTQSLLVSLRRIPSLCHVSKASVAALGLCRRIKGQSKTLESNCRLTGGFKVYAKGSSPSRGSRHEEA